MSRSSSEPSGEEITQSVIDGIVTRSQFVPNSTYWRYHKAIGAAFDPDVFDEQKLAAKDLLRGVAHAGRGNTHFFCIGAQELVLRHYRRGGMAQRISKDRYLYTGLERTRAMQEFSVLLELQKRALGAPKPYACRVVRHGASYSASLITYRLPGHTLAENIATDSVDVRIWSAIGDTIGRFHAEGLFHADLNAHNIMIDSLGRIALIDFDRAAFRKNQLSNPLGGWRRQNVKRLYRSLKKISQQKHVAGSDQLRDGDASKESTSVVGYEDGYKALLKSWEAQLTKRP